jgi:hypothetical protein
MRKNDKSIQKVMQTRICRARLVGLRLLRKQLWLWLLWRSDSSEGAEAVLEKYLAKQLHFVDEDVKCL